MSKKSENRTISPLTKLSYGDVAFVTAILAGSIELCLGLILGLEELGLERGLFAGLTGTQVAC